MSDNTLKSLPGAEIVLPGLADLEAGRTSVNASAVRNAAARLRRAGVDVPAAEGDVPAAHLLYRQLSDELGDAPSPAAAQNLGALSSFSNVADITLDFMPANVQIWAIPILQS